MLVVRFEDECLLVVEKPAGMHTAPLRPGEGGTLLELVMEAYPEVRDVPGIKPVEPGLLHRLDRDTSGLVVVARTADAFEVLRDAFDTMRKEYVAACVTKDDAAETSFRVTSRFAPYGPGRRRVRVVTDDGGSGRAPRETTRDTYTTEVTVTRRDGGRALVRAALTRGFRHQVRVHLSYVGLPIIGDPLYGKPVPPEFAPRMYLHAALVALRHPRTGAALVVESPAPPEFAAFFSNASRPVAGQTETKGATT
ncbi:MAG TPA: RluA family pseudouridine synthase [Spirochaetia bacterium]